MCIIIGHLSQSDLFAHEFRTARPPRPVYCHQEFLDKLALRRNEPVGKRAALLLQRMAVDVARLHYKPTSGVNRGWRRSRLGGSAGSHFYAWWAPSGAAPVRNTSFQAGPEAVFLRDIRHHDDHAPLDAGSLSKDYLPMSVSDLRGDEYAPEPWTSSQARFARSRGDARILKGHPGSGKTTALLHAADESQAERVLYLTFSRDLAALARDYFDRFCSSARTFTVLPYPVWIAQLSGRRGNEPDLAAARAQFRKDLLNHQRALGPWSNDIDGLYDEMHAHLVGAAIPEKSGRFPKAERVRLPEAAYRAQRTRYLGAATDSVIEAARRLDRVGEAPLADRYFPELALAWRAAQSLTSASHRIEPSLPDYGCIAVDEVQDLTPLEVFVILSLSRQLNSGSRRGSLLLAGDEAQTVRATDFEWAWLNDMLHETFSQPQEFRLLVNLRSPRRIAGLVNRAWDLYDYLHKQERPSGTGYAEIDDDSPDQVLYSALPRGELAPLLAELSRREGLALIAFDKSKLPHESLPFVLSPAEAKGLDFQSVCLLNGGALLLRIVDERANGTAAALAKRLAIDQLRVALSRPTERLIWLDTSPEPATVREVSRFLRPTGETALAPITVEALRTCLEEEELEVEERIQRCERDARQLVPVKPDLAWSRAQQAVALLGNPGDTLAVMDGLAREAAYMTLAEVCFQLAFRKQSLSPELGRPDLYQEAADAARSAGKFLLANTIRAIGATGHGNRAEHLNQIGNVIQLISEAREELPAWFIVEATAQAEVWLEELDRHLDAGDNALLAQRMLPPFFDALRLPDALDRKNRLAQRCLQILMKSRRYVQALAIIESLPEAKPKLAAECYEGSGQFDKAAAIYLEQGDREKALRCFRSVPDFESALRLVRQMEAHPARASLEWLGELDALLARRPENFNRAMTPPEKKLLEAMLERGLGVQRKKPAVKKAASAARKTAPRKTAAEKTAIGDPKDAPDAPAKRPQRKRKSE
jgi:tetratricopeptide (TPR) repeat protein